MSVERYDLIAQIYNNLKDLGFCDTQIKQLMTIIMDLARQVR